LVGCGLGLVAGCTCHRRAPAQRIIVGYKPAMVIPWPIVWIGVGVVLLISFLASLGPALG